MDGYETFRFRTRDGLTLAGRSYGSRSLPGLPVVCLAGLTRNAADFDALARYLCHERRVVSLDMRGRGASERDPNPDNYDLVVEATDAIDGIAAAGIEDCAIVGTSRGAILAIVISAIRPAIMRAVVMNDLGPVIEPEGLRAIRDYLSRSPAVANWDEAAASAKVAHGASFPKVDDAGWERFARAVFTERSGSIVPAHDPAIHRTLDAVAAGAMPPPMWTAFAGLRRLPVLSIRGQLSTLFCAETQEEMARRHPALRTHVVPDQGHAPLLDDEPTMSAISQFLASVDH